MHDLPTDWSALCAIIFLLGMRHGFDADHLATIDGLTRLSSRRHSVFSRYCGVLFSLGHGIVVMTIAVVIGLLSERWAPPAWLGTFGTWTSITFLLLLGIVNLHAVLRSEWGNPVPLVGVKGRVFGRIMQVQSATGVAAVGALFALSFDTVGQAALFAVTATQYGGLAHAVMLGLLFVLGMIVTDGLNGWWILRLIARADQIAALASRIMSVAVSSVSLLVAGLGIGKMASPWIDSWSEGKELAFGAVVVVVLAVSYLVASALARIQRPERQVQ
jgi:nickel/cobalt transporter (NiCoT) family protein